MLGKLLKYEFKDTGRILPFIYLITAIFAIMAMVANELKIEWFRITSSVILILVGIALVIVTLVIIIMRFYKNLYTNEGYLMFTLPVKPHLHLVSKVITAFVWMVISVIFMVGAIFISLYCLGVPVDEFNQMMSELKRLGLEKFVYFIIPMMFLSILCLLSMIFFSITVSNRPAFHRMSGAAAFLIFLGTYIALQILQTVVAVFAPLSIQIDIAGKTGLSLSTKNMFGYLMESMKGIEPTSLTIGVGGYMFVLIAVCVLFYLTGRMMNRKTSLK